VPTILQVDLKLVARYGKGAIRRAVHLTTDD
jgi:hypothetical protein